MNPTAPIIQIVVMLVLALAILFGVFRKGWLLKRVGFSLIFLNILTCIALLFNVGVHTWTFVSLAVVNCIGLSVMINEWDKDGVEAYDTHIDDTALF